MQSIRPSWSDIKSRHECKEHKVEVRRRIYSSGQVTYWQQCVICGQEARQLRKGEVPLGARSTPDFPDYDETLKNDFYRKISDELQEEQESFDLAEAYRRRATYENYLASPEWAQRRAKVMKRANGICESCGEARAVQVHHRTYANLGNEPLWDLAAVCIPCHEAIHRRGAA